MKKELLLAVALAAFPLHSCIESNPQPLPETNRTEGEPEPAESPGWVSSKNVDEGRIYMSAPDENNEAIIVGDSGAAMGANEVYVESLSDDAGTDAETFAVAQDGSFVIFLPGVVGSSVDLVFSFPDGTEVLVTLLVPRWKEEGEVDVNAPWVVLGGASSEERGGERPPSYRRFDGGRGGIAATARGDGNIEVRGSEFSVTPLSIVVVVNLSNNEKALTSATNVGSFALTLPGNAGDGISLFAVNPADHTKATETVYLTVL